MTRKKIPDIYSNIEREYEKALKTKIKEGDVNISHECEEITKCVILKGEKYILEYVAVKSGKQPKVCDFIVFCERNGVNGVLIEVKASRTIHAHDIIEKVEKTAEETIQIKNKCQIDKITYKPVLVYKDGGITTSEHAILRKKTINIEGRKVYIELHKYNKNKTRLLHFL